MARRSRDCFYGWGEGGQSWVGEVRVRLVRVGTQGINLAASARPDLYVLKGCVQQSGGCDGAPSH